MFSLPIFGVFIKRYKRFLVDVELENGTLVTAHCPNPGRMMGLLKPFSPVILTKSPNPLRKLLFTLEAMKPDDLWIGVNTRRPNDIIAEALTHREIPSLSSCLSYKREVTYGKNSRIDFLLRCPSEENYYLEIKNVHMVRDSFVAEFPDSVTQRGAKHMEELTKLAEKGKACKVIYVVQRADCHSFQFAEDIDPFYTKAARNALKAGVTMEAFSCDLIIKKDLPFSVCLSTPLIMNNP